ncbi:MAG: tRNA (N6-isopentenyl adenosine(37)-C2)-methylthiotransferase MiaB [Candidatus Omnitrophota bacterium]
MKKIFLQTYGCQMNEYDSELVRSVLLQAGYSFVDTAQAADVILVNTCSVRENATRKVLGLLQKIRHDKNGQPAIYGILGCMATSLKETLLADPHVHVDLLAGPDSYRRLPELIRQTAQKGSFDTALSDTETYEDIYPDRISSVNAWIAIMRGCNNFCSYCVVPYARGRERSRSAESIIEETHRLAEEGFKQVTLLGQNVNSYRHGSTDFPRLLDEVSRVGGLERVWFTSPHPKDVPDELIGLIADNPRICNHIHLPLQSGNTSVLKKMNRPYSKEQYLKLVDKIRARCPQAAVTTDIIVGFPTETDRQFEDTVDVFKTVGYDSAFIFKYSPRPHTAASRHFPDDIPEEVKTARIMQLNDLQKSHALRCNTALIGTVKDVLVEKSMHADGEGRTIENKRVRFSSLKNDILAGDILPVRIEQATPHLLKGSPAA